MPVQTLLSELSVQALNERILRRLSRLNKPKLYVSVSTPEKHGLAGKFRTVITDNLVRLGTFFDELIEEPRDLAAAD